MTIKVLVELEREEWELIHVFINRELAISDAIEDNEIIAAYRKQDLALSRLESQIP